MAHWYTDPAELRKRREAQKISQMELAKAAKVSQGYLSQLEEGIRPFVEPTRQRLWEALAEIEASRPGYVPPVQHAVKLSSLLRPQTMQDANQAAAQEDALPLNVCWTIELLEAMGLDKTPEQRHAAEIEAYKDLVKAKEAELAHETAIRDEQAAKREGYIKLLEDMVANQKELLALQDQRDNWFQPLSDELERVKASNAELLDLLGIETQEGILHWKKEELREKIQQKAKPVSSDKSED